MDSSTAPRQMLRLTHLCRKLNLSKSSIYTMVSEGRLPRPKQLGRRAVAWVEQEVDAHIAALPTTAPSTSLERKPAVPTPRVPLDPNAPPRRPRGRPRKHPLPTDTSMNTTATSEAA